MKDAITMNKKERDTMIILEQLCQGYITNKEAAKKLGLSVRQVQRKKQCYISYGAPSVIHQSKDKPSGQGYGSEFKEKIVALYLEEYNGWNYSHFRDTLEDEHGIMVSRPFVHKLLSRQVGPSPKTKRHQPTHHPPRPRRECAGELLQLDASMHRWFGEDYPHYYLHGAIDDATGRITGCVMMDGETNLGYQLVLKDTIEQYGLPDCLYTDRRTIFKSPRTLTIEEQIQGKALEGPPFVRMTKRLGIKIITTSVPQAKGRIERLWGTFQDRLIKELAKLNIKTKEEANRYIKEIFLPRFNARFATPIDDARNHFTPVAEDFNCDVELALTTERKVLHHSYVRYFNQFYIICKDDGTKYFPGKDTVHVHANLDGTLKARIDDVFYDLSPVERVELPKPEPKPKHTPEETNKLKSIAGKKGAANSPWHQYTKYFMSYEKRISED